MMKSSRNKKKRSHSPAESNDSFVKNVTSTISNLLPSSIIKWFSPSSSSNTNGSTPTGDPTDSSSEDEIPDTSVVVQPPPKRMRYKSPNVNHLGQSKVNYSTDSVDAIEQYDIIQSTSSRNHFKSAPNYVSTPIQTVINEPSNERRECETTVIKSHSYSTKGPCLTKKRKSLFEIYDKDSKQAKKETVIKERETSGSNDYSQSSFKPGPLSSTFYRGQITYGGAASSYMNQPNIKSLKTTRVNETSKHDNTISHSARRVMELFEHYCSPPLESKQISPYVTSHNNSSSIKSMENSSRSCEKCHSVKTQELYVPNVASILQLKKRLRIMGTTKAARQIVASHSSAIKYSPYSKSKPQSELSNKTTEKLETSGEIRTKSNESTDSIHDLPTPTKLPTAVLQIDQNNLPKFNFGTQVVSTSYSLSNQTAPILKSALPVAPEIKLKISTKELSNDIHSSELEPSSDNNPYKFATQVVVSRDKLLTSEVPKFTFEYPILNVIEIDSIKEKKKTTPVLIVTDNTNTITEKPKDWKCSDCWVVNKADASNCVCCSAKKLKEQIKALHTCPVCQSEVTEGGGQDKCSKCKEAPKSNGSTSLPITSLQSKTWRCRDCWVDNAESSEKCVCCGFKYPKTSESIEHLSTNALESYWKCSDCWIKNKSNVDKCIACGGVKPNSALNSKPTTSLIPNKNITSSSSFKARDNTFNNFLKAQTDKWECSNCLVRNDTDKTKCVCCETEKTGMIKESKTTSFNFGMNTNTSFKFGIDPKVQVDNCNKDLESEKCIEKSSTSEKLETNNNVLAKTPTFTFGLPAIKIDDKNKETLATSVSKAIEVPKLNFTFGMPKQTTNTTETVKLNSNREKLAAISEEKLPQVPTITISQVQSQNTATEQKNIFESNLGSQESLLKVPSSNISEVTGTATEEKNITFKPSTPETVSNIETNKPNPFTQTGLKISTNLFNITTSTIANASTSTNFTTLSVPVTANSTLFQKSYLDTKPTDTLFQTTGSAQSDTNLFQNPKTTNETTAPTFSTSTKLFSFGNNTQNSFLESGHSKFNFSFGNTNKADMTPMFNTTFGMNKDSNTSLNSNKFNLSTSNNVGTNSSLPGSLLETGNLLTTGNPIMCNNLSGNNGTTTGNPLSIPDLGNNSLNTGNNLKSANPLSTTPSNGIFGSTGQKENMWSNSNNVPGNLFVSNTATNSLQRPATFTFGSSTPFDGSNTGTAFGNDTSNVFTMQNPSSNLSSLFSNTPQPQTVPTIFGNSQTTSSPAPTMGVFGSTNPPTNSFNVHNPTIPVFETQPQNPMTAPSFNFGAQQQLGTVPFGFGQQQPQQFQSPVYNFGANQSTPQFNMGSAPNTTVRRVRKAVRRTTQR